MVTVISELRARLGDAVGVEESTRDGIPTVWVEPGRIAEVMRHLKPAYPMLFDLYGVDERTRVHRDGLPPADFTVVYQLSSFGQDGDLRVKAALQGESPSLPTISGVWPCANWYEREAWDLCGIRFDGHPNLRRILMPPTWQGHPLRKDHPARATEIEPYQLSMAKEDAEHDALTFRPEEYGMASGRNDTDFLFLNLGPQHPGTHGLLRVILQLDGENIVDAVPDIGYHHRGAEKMGERQSWHSYIPYTDRIDYLGGVMNNLPYVMAVEKLAGIEVPDRAKVIRIMMAELFRVISHLVWYGTFAQDLGAMSPVFYMFNDRERAFGIVEAICGGRMHPSWFRIGGTAHDLPHGWDGLIRDFLHYLPKRIDDYDKALMKNHIFRGRTVGVGVFTKEQAIEWGVTGPGLRATGFAWDLRKARPYAGYDQFEFEVPTGHRGDCFDRAAVHVEEIRQSLRIIEQCMNNMPEGPYKSDHPLATPPRKERTMRDIETLITHFLGVSWGPVIPPGEASATVEASKGQNAYSLISDGNTVSYRTRIRTPSFPHMQMLPVICRNHKVSDLLAILGAMDYVLADLDR
ncbi:MAG TPA: NADH-quinone oxidoreductase subunit C/D [Candidatus Hydrogenedentes bacterium]|nr:NADH-quinone oxidoreductase subunit C/D [Candidatus Hydrogenedentota bacterium]HOV74334.1 NADH-quinone oxidoreductase subunit C/D [Candidatus Hydrogenedentota bacterium]HPC14973.1 NADH-quinone oxidoreductase subunit C/D [Candidatus Hydrogenedentota bacterium]HRT19166.1 NADH-quinone oxidoreductase subunit C/D [Candidatus Hydrogenedentota bacterium]HRT64095.1 NADH-quinone oxidoreductase subunit C/D [Candidatus Hydrogenedentota bacterium]